MISFGESIVNRHANQLLTMKLPGQSQTEFIMGKKGDLTKGDLTLLVPDELD